MKKLDLTITPLNSWLPGNEKPLVISGPCSAETEEQVLATANAIAALGGVSIFRAGIWKPRTRPNAFEGVGSKGLLWLKKVKEETGLLTATEVANAYHVEECLKNGIDILWIGARTTVNPFSVQEIADALKGVDIPVFVKNPIHPDLQLWIGALERINRAGITKLAAIHRGFHSYEEKSYRNVPNWELAIELKMLCPDLPLICDPSHICGRTSLLSAVAQKAMDLDMDGLMIETHCSPETALSDKDQQITPSALLKLISELVIRDVSSKNLSFSNKLVELRCNIDNADKQILLAMSQRMSIVKEIGEYKKENSVTILQIKRWKQILKNQLTTADKTGLSKEFIKDLYLLVHNESIRMQTEIMNRSEIKS
ncbi:MAG: bifunctional 3-deoxy-7-phosphoheptulonate synthase/chorismate mutase type II [Bacteroidota bacterium]|nr:bifunctional 3-deoxy-7-phosphoheptulonate synthase/chorismate mutase type II [Bacteroidota bacterium]